MSNLEESYIQLNVTIPATLRSIQMLSAITRAFAQGLSDDPYFVSEVELCAVEIANNIVKHGYRNNDKGTITLTAEAASNHVRISLQDTAPHFNPLENIHYEEGDEMPLNIENVREHSLGLGRHIVIHTADQLEYQKLPVGNRLTFVKYMPESQSDS